MRLSLHTASIPHTNVAADVSAARTAGFDGLELWIPKLTRYLAAGHTATDLATLLGDLDVTMLDVLGPIESRDLNERRRLLQTCAHMAEVAAGVACPALQVIALDGFPSHGITSCRRIVRDSLMELSDVASAYGIRLALEPVVFSRFRSLTEAVDLIYQVGPDRVGLVLDTWHLWTAGTSWDEVAKLDPALVCTAHIADSAPKAGSGWSDDDRTALPGDGVVPLHAAISSIRSTGYDGTWAIEILSKWHAEWEPHLLARELLTRARNLLVGNLETELL